MIRRDILRYLLAAPVAGSTFLYKNPLNPVLREAHAATGKSLVVIFKRGGCDGLNALVPHGDDEYYNLRPTIGISRPGTGAGSAIDLDGFFGLHPALAPLLPIFDNNHLAILPTVHYSNASRSHFSSQDFIESGVVSTGLTDGWLNRHLESFSQSGVLRAVSFGGLAHSLRGDASVATISDINNFNFNSRFSDDFLNRMEKVIGQPINPNDHNRYLLHEHGQVMLDNLKVLSQIDTENYQPSGGATYPSSGYGRQLKQVAQLIKEDVGLEIATINIGGWDTHSNQGGATGNQANRFTDYANGIAAIYNDLGNLMNNVVILTITEFGRTAMENASAGTDHGNAACWFAVGHGVKGGIHGEWPGLLANQLYRGRYLAHTVEYRDIFAEITANHLGNNTGIGSVLPGYTPPSNPLGILA